MNELSSISEDGQWDEGETAKGVFYLASRETSRIPESASRQPTEMVAPSQAGELGTGTSLDLMDTIAASLSINEHRQVAVTLAKLSSVQNWDQANRMVATSEAFRLVTGVPLDAEARMGAAVDQAGVGVRTCDSNDAFTDREIDSATEIIKQSLTSDLTSAGLESPLGN